MPMYVSLLGGGGGGGGSGLLALEGRHHVLFTLSPVCPSGHRALEAFA